MTIEGDRNAFMEVSFFFFFFFFFQLTGVPFVVGNPWPGEWVAVAGWQCWNRLLLAVILSLKSLHLDEC
jgi:hypothetical protein